MKETTLSATHSSTPRTGRTGRTGRPAAGQAQRRRLGDRPAADHAFDVPGGQHPVAKGGRRYARWVPLALLPVLAVGLAVVVLNSVHAPALPTAAPGSSAVAGAPGASGAPPSAGNVKGRPDAPVEIEEWGDFQ